MTTVVFGLGHPDRGDDAVGLLVADRVARARPHGISAVRAVEGSPLRLLSLWSADDRVVVVDALRADAQPGAIRRFDAHAQPLAGRPGGGSHDTSLCDAVELARALGRLPRTLVVYGVVGARFEVGEPMTPAVLDAVVPTAERVAAEAAVGPRVGAP